MSNAGAGDLVGRLGLNADPFAAGALPDFFFVGGQRRFLAQQVVHALYFAGGMVLLLGDDGAGKTRIVDEVCRELRELADICRIEATVLMDAAQVRLQLAKTLGLAPGQAEDNGQLIMALAQLRPGIEEPLPVVLVIDDAHVLAVPVLAECEQLVQGTGGRLRLLLSGESELASAWSQLGGVAIERIDVPPLDRRETADYLRTRLQAAGYRDELPLTELQVQELYRHSQGNIAAIHRLAPVLLTDSPGSGAKMQIKGLPVLHIGAAALLLTVLIVLFLYRGNGGDEPAQSAATSSGPEGRASIPLTLPTDVPGKSQPAAAQSTSPSAPPTAAQDTVEPSPIKVPEPEPTPAPAPRELPPPKTVPESAPAPEPITKPAPVAIKPASEPAVKPMQEPAVKPAPVAEPALAADEKRLLALPAQQFVVQLMAGSSKDKVVKFIVGAAPAGNIYYFESRLKGKPWHVAVTGPYADKAAANAAIAKFPAVLRNEKPWPRSIASVQADIRGR